MWDSMKQMTEETGLKIYEKLGGIEQYMTGVIKCPSNFNDVLITVQSGKHALSFTQGDQLIPIWKEMEESTEYNDPFDIIQVECAPELKNGEIVHGMMLQQHYANVRACPFDPQEALFDADVELPAGTYHFTVVGNTWITSENGKTIQFTLNTPVPAGGQLVFADSEEFNKVLAGQRISSFASPTSFEAIESVALSEGCEGIDLGYTDGKDKLNHYQCAFRGSGRWKTSMLRQYLNSSEPTGEWWVKQGKWDRASTFINSCPGYMAGFNSDFLAVIKPVKVQTARDTVISDGGLDITYDCFFPISMQQMNIVPQISDVEGEPLAYWKDIASGASDLDPSRRFYQHRTYPDLRVFGLDEKNAARYCWLRSAYRSFPYYVYGVYSSGYISGSSAMGCNYCAPACVIC